MVVADVGWSFLRQTNFLLIKQLSRLMPIFFLIKICCSGIQAPCGPKSLWVPAPITKWGPTIVQLSATLCPPTDEVAGLRYAWRDWPCDFKACPIYSASGILPAPPFIFNRYPQKGEVRKSHWTRNCRRQCDKTTLESKWADSTSNVCQCGRTPTIILSLWASKAVIDACVRACFYIYLYIHTIYTVRLEPLPIIAGLYECKNACFYFNKTLIQINPFDLHNLDKSTTKFMWMCFFQAKTFALVKKEWNYWLIQTWFNWKTWIKVPTVKYQCYSMSCAKTREWESLITFLSFSCVIQLVKKVVLITF